jgi:hypothetical protein
VKIQCDNNVETQCIASLQSPSPTIGSIIPPAKNKFGPQSKNLAAIIHRFKAAITKQAHEIHADFACQSRVQTPHIKTLKQNTDYQ